MRNGYLVKIYKRTVNVTNIREIEAIAIVEGSAFLMLYGRVYTQNPTILQPVQPKIEVGSILNQTKDSW